MGNPYRLPRPIYHIFNFALLGARYHPDALSPPDLFSGIFLFTLQLPDGIAKASCECRDETPSHSPENGRTFAAAAPRRLVCPDWLSPGSPSFFVLKTLLSVISFSQSPYLRCTSPFSAAPISLFTRVPKRNADLPLPFSDPK